MTFAKARQIATDRLQEVLVFVNHITELEPKLGVDADGSAGAVQVPIVTPQHVNIMKGLFFVQLYGALEKSVSDLVQILLSSIVTLEPKNQHVSLEFNVVSMARKWKSVKDTGHNKAFMQMTDFFAKIRSPGYLGIDDTLFSSLLQNVWANTLDEVTGALGIPTMLTVNDRALVDELVDKRNAVAHGRESTSVIGQRYRSNDLRKRLNDVQALIFKVIDRFEEYYEKREFIQAEHVALYP